METFRFSEEDLVRIAERYGPNKVGQRIMRRLESIDPNYHWVDGKVSKEKPTYNYDDWKKSTLEKVFEQEEKAKNDIKNAVAAKVNELVDKLGTVIDGPVGAEEYSKKVFDLEEVRQICDKVFIETYDLAHDGGYPIG